MAVIRRITYRSSRSLPAGDAYGLYHTFMESEVVRSAIRKLELERRAVWRRVDKGMFKLRGSPLGDFDAFMETADSLPLVIRGEAGQFNSSGKWIKK